jgi:hypothetical protein
VKRDGRGSVTVVQEEQTRNLYKIAGNKEKVEERRRRNW